MTTATIKGGAARKRAKTATPPIRIKPFSVSSGKYRFRFTPEDAGFSVSCTTVPGVNTQGDTFEEALANAHKAAAFVEECLAEIAAEKSPPKRKRS